MVKPLQIESVCVWGLEKLVYCSEIVLIVVRKLWNVSWIMCKQSRKTIIILLLFLLTQSQLTTVGISKRKVLKRRWRICECLTRHPWFWETCFCITVETGIKSTTFNCLAAPFQTLTATVSISCCLLFQLLPILFLQLDRHCFTRKLWNDASWTRILLFLHQFHSSTLILTVVLYIC